MASQSFQNQVPTANCSIFLELYHQAKQKHRVFVYCTLPNCNHLPMV